MKKKFLLAMSAAVLAFCTAFAVAACSSTNVYINYPEDEAEKSAGEDPESGGEDLDGTGTEETGETDGKYSEEAPYFTKTDPIDAVPEAGYSGNEYVNYVAYVLEQQTEWYAVTDSQAKASVNNQQVWTDKFYKDGYMLTTLKSYSTFSKEASESLFVTGRQGSEEEERGVYVRDGSKPKDKNHDFSDIDWDEGQPTYYLEEDYYFLYGLFSDEMSVFVIYDQTIEKTDAVVKNGDGTYSQHFVLDTENSVYYYQYSMKNHGGLSTFPAFEKVEVTMTFNEGFELLKLETTEQSKIRKAGSNWTNETAATTTYTYPGMAAEEDPNGRGWDAVRSDAEDTLGEAEEYFGAYYGKLVPSGTESGNGPDAAEVLMGALGKCLTSEGETYAMNLAYGDADVSGYLFAAVDLENWEGLTFDFSDFGTMDWVRLALEAYEYAHFIIAVDDEEGKQAVLVDLLPGSNIFELLSGKVADLYVSDVALAVSGTAETSLTALFSATETFANHTESGYGLVLEYGDTKGTSLAKVTLMADGLEMRAECLVTKTVSEDGTEYGYEFSELTIDMPSAELEIKLAPDTGDKTAHVTPANGMNHICLDTLVSALINSVLDLSSSSYICESYTFSGSLSLSVGLGDAGETEIKIDNLVVTAGDIFDGFYLSLVGDLAESGLSSASTIAVTLYGDFVVLARGLETAEPSYMVVTSDELRENAFCKDADISPLAWLLGADTDAWVAFAESSDFGADYDMTMGSFDVLHLGDYVTGMEIVLNGEIEASAGDFSAEETFGLTDDFWAFEINSDFLSYLTSGVVTKGCIAVTQSMSQIGGLYFVGKTRSGVSFSLKLSSFESNPKGIYDILSGNLDLESTDVCVVPNIYILLEELIGT